MANSQSHKLGEFIGAFFEDLMKKPFSDFADKNGLYFDTIGPRKARRGKKVTWTDIHGSKHDLDFVLEKAAPRILSVSPSHSLNWHGEVTLSIPKTRRRKYKVLSIPSVRNISS